MGITKKQLGQIKEFAYEQVKKNDKLHQELHINQTVKLSISLAKKEKADITKCIAIAYLHDIAKHKQSETVNHGDQGAIDSKKFLQTINLDPRDIEEICYAIQQHNKGDSKKTKEASIIWDADKIQTFGAYGIIRSLFYNTHIYPNKNQDQLLVETIKDIRFFQNRAHTKTGKKIAKKSEKFLQKFIKNYEATKTSKL